MSGWRRLVALLVAILFIAGVALVAWLQATVPASVAQTPGVSAPAPPPSTVPTPGEPEVVAERPCPDSEFTCVTLRVPRDHFAPGGQTFDVTFGLLRATSNDPKGAFVTVTGGPGTSGLAVADSYTEALDPAISEAYDIVFFDQRGIGLSEPLGCPDATLAWYTTESDPTRSRSDAEMLAAAAEQFAGDCVDEAGVAVEDLAFYATRQAVEDLEAFRTWLGVERLDLYGESYGTQFAQTYAAAHPDRVRTLFLDGAVDLTLSGFDYYGSQARAFDEVLRTTLDACDAAPECVADMDGGDPLAAYDDLAAELREAGPIGFDFVLADGSAELRGLTLAALETAAAGYLYHPFDRMLLQRALAHASRGELAPMARLAYISLGQDPETLDAIPDPTYSDALYYAVECSDYAFGSGTTDERADAYLDAGEAAGLADVRIGSVFYGDLPCAYWPVSIATEERPAYLDDAPFPIFVLSSTTDPATPHDGALRIAEAAADSYLIVQPGGPHILFGRGEPCPDEIITAYLVDDELPPRETTCDEWGVDPYLPIPAATPPGYADAEALLVAIDDDLNANPDYWAWDGAGELAVGCLGGGTLTYVASDVGYDVALADCELTIDLPLTGSAVIDDVEGTFSLEVTAPGGTDLRYHRDAEGALTIEGSFQPS